MEATVGLSLILVPKVCVMSAVVLYTAIQLV